MNQPECFALSEYKTIESRCKLPKYLQKQWKEKLGWMYTFPWRPEQERILRDFQSAPWKLFIIQAIFGGGKTTMILAMIFDLIVQQKTTAERIMVSAFNVAIKNEIRKKLRYAGKIVPRTFDSIVWEICKEMNYPLLLDPNFQEKRKFLYQNLASIPSTDTIDYIFLDEAQDLERPVYAIFQKRFPNAKYVIVGDIFQSIQKEPRESFLWSLLQQKLPFTYTMENTPRVPYPILNDIKYALSQHYPEFHSTISKWTSSKRVSFPRGIRWHTFSSYSTVFEKMYQFVQEHGMENSMILVFSSAVTVRGTLGDVSRVRRYFVQRGIPVNSNHKLMRDDRLFISTVNSSKGLERNHVFVFLTFPLELAFSNFSADILMNLVTVGMSRCKESIVFHVPAFSDRFSPLLHSYEHCPHPNQTNNNEQDKREVLHEEFFQLKPYLLQKDHSVTEIIRLQILSYSLQKKLLSFSKKYQETVLPPTSLSFKSEEECTLVGLLFETLILSEWEKHWPNHLDTIGSVGHSVYDAFQGPIRQLHQEWIQWKRNHSFLSLSYRQQVEGALLYSRIHLACYQKIFCTLPPSCLGVLVHRWVEIKPHLHQFRPKNIKTQDKVHYSFINGILDMSFENEQDDFIEIIEIKASRQKEWLTNALLQAIVYGMCKHRSNYRIHLFNVLSKSWKHYYVSFGADFKQMLRAMTNEIQLWNLNCFLCKNRSIHDPARKNFFFEHCLFLDGRYDSEQGWTSLSLFEFASPTKMELLTFIEGRESIETFLKREYLVMLQDLHVTKVIVSRFLTKTILSSFVDLSTTDTRFLNPQTEWTKEYWKAYLEGSGWTTELKSLPPEHVGTRLNWKHDISSTSAQVAFLCAQYNFVN